MTARAKPVTIATMNASIWLLLISVAAVNLMGAASPGPAFFVVSRTAVGQSRRAGLATACGVVLATMVWAFATIHGLALLFGKAPWLLHLLQVFGGSYLLYLAWQSIRHANDPLPLSNPRCTAGNLAEAFRRGFVTNLANPKIAVFFGTVFTAVYGPGMPEWINLAVLAVIFVDEIVWYNLVVLAFSSRPAQTAYGRAKRWIDRSFGALLGLFGLRLIANLRLLLA
jgi:RhtB (resistance to homoserine/threonine) family protein